MCIFHSRLRSEDTWRRTTMFWERYPNLYNVTYNPHDSVALVMSEVPYNLSFRHDLIRVKRMEYEKLMAKISNCRLTEERDKIS